MIVELNQRSKEVFKHIVDAYMTSGVPVGSRTVSRRLQEQLSPATIRNVMSDLEELGLLFAPHTSAGRLPTEAGLRLYVDGLLEIGAVAHDERARIESHCAGVGRSVEGVLSDALETLSGLTHYAGIVMAPTSERAYRHVEFVPLGPGRALVVTVADNGVVENRVIEVPVGMSASTLVEAGNYLTARLGGRTLAEARRQIETEIETQKGQLGELTRKVVEAGLATWSNGTDSEGLLIVRGQAKLLEDIDNLVDLEHIRNLFEALETKRSFLRLIESAQAGNGVQVFIGAENELFALSGCSAIIAPYGSREENGRKSLVGAIGVVGPTRMNYSRIVPVVDYTARVISQMLGSPEFHEKDP
ncbi:MAG: heat-inducible transcriptional repressor HrcA [Geminicoccaceae bacterium]|nr:heat-inducible transcriptional repressor HrcA [Geminicoccaceae bacterium]